MRMGKWEEQESLPMDEITELTEAERQYEAVIEAVLFTMGSSVELRQLAAAIDQDEKAARQAVLRLKRRYESSAGGMQVIELEGSYQMCTRPEFYENLIKVASTPKKQVLTDVVLETLSIIAYKQPVTKMEIEKIRGVKSDHAVNRLVEYNLVYEVGRMDAPGRPALFATTEEFLRRFGIGSTQNLPVADPVKAAEIRLEVEEELKLNGDELTGLEAGDGEDTRETAGKAADARYAEEAVPEAADARSAEEDASAAVKEAAAVLEDGIGKEIILEDMISEEEALEEILEEAALEDTDEPEY